MLSNVFLDIDTNMLFVCAFEMLSSRYSSKTVPKLHTSSHLGWAVPLRVNATAGSTPMPEVPCFVVLFLW